MLTSPYASPRVGPARRAVFPLHATAIPSMSARAHGHFGDCGVWLCCPRCLEAAQKDAGGAFSAGQSSCASLRCKRAAAVQHASYLARRGVFAYVDPMCARLSCRSQRISSTSVTPAPFFLSVLVSAVHVHVCVHISFESNPGDRRELRGDSGDLRVADAVAVNAGMVMEKEESARCQVREA
jgi:hypothetical protein